MADNSSSDNEFPSAIGEFCWFEIPVHDVARAQKLYGDVFGWEFESEPWPCGKDGVVSYHLFHSRGKALHGAFNLLEEGHEATKHAGGGKQEATPPLPSFVVEECDAALEKVKSHGGAMQCPKTEIPRDRGFYARFTDTEGNVIGIWSRK
ncbi:hypothetical protein JDV02_002165 [Purpureocillium takamizusanense]|uniref:VOC domain-containing protein n=1 Tax=Purpureocillium takamizusanense TaxID=2060973 RepID=A0A9Q8Q872_9HYPO|nr:uncharacterized protein JDV02_002165 [Purpureocillium takamizusanense]UNI15654.1 hypothetical protein JDV02_002165 [Purpureocillium takamizusanense]